MNLWSFFFQRSPINKACSNCGSKAPVAFWDAYHSVVFSKDFLEFFGILSHSHLKLQQKHRVSDGLGVLKMGPFEATVLRGLRSVSLGCACGWQAKAKAAINKCRADNLDGKRNEPNHGVLA